jgi:3-hydroxyisobutyrate dehydrogenase-like beta-hydroxyacid dehydrogenase
MKVGFIGVGNMGGPMCRNIIKNSNHDVVVYDLNESAVKTCTDLGARAGTSPAAIAAEVDVIMTSLPMPADVERVTLGPEGIAEGAHEGLVYFDLSTNAPSMVKRIAQSLGEKGITMLDSPVSGGVEGAEAGTIAVMIGGDKAAFDKHLSLFQSFGKTIIHCGELGAGSVAKIVNNMVAFCNMAAAAEGLMLGAKAGLDPKILDQVVRSSSGDSFSFRSLADKTLAGEFEARFALRLAYKDMHLAMELADEIAVPLQLSPQVHNLMRMAKGLGYFDHDMAAIMKVYEHTMGHEVRG